MTLNPTNHNVTTAGAENTLTVSQILGGFLTRSGTGQGYTDTLPATADILSALGAQTPFVLTYINATGSYQGGLEAGDDDTTIVYGAGMLGGEKIQSGQIVVILFTPTGDTLTVTLLYPIANPND